MLKSKKYKYFALLYILLGFFMPTSIRSENPKLNIGMNMNFYSYFSSSLYFVDVMKSASEWITYNASGSSPWDTGKSGQLTLDNQGYPLELPAKIDNGPPQGVRFLINNIYKGDYLFTYDGEGEFEFSVANTKSNGNIILHLDGKGENRWINIKKSNKNNHVRNIRILPKGVKYDPKLPFYPLLLEGLEKFHCLRFMDFINTNNSTQTTWDTRTKPDFYTQGGKTGVAYEYAIELCNQLNCDAWICIPHKADDDYIRKLALLVRDNLEPSLKVYVEYSNEIWNWQFGQSQYVLNNAPGAIDKYVSEDLKNINPQGADHPEKDAYMMQRVFKIWSEVFGPDQTHRLVRVAAVQHAWWDNTRRILEYLFKHDQNGKPLTGKRYQASTGAGCDVISPAGYFGISDEGKKKLLEMNPKQVTADVILDTVKNGYDKGTGSWTLNTAKFAKAWNVGFVVYEGGQHLVPFDQDSAYDEAIWDAQINPKMYDMYMTMFKTHVKPEVNCQLFCAYSYISARRSKYGSWGHIEKLGQLNDMSNIKTIAPKYSALLDANIAK